MEKSKTKEKKHKIVCVEQANLPDKIKLHIAKPIEEKMSPRKCPMHLKTEGDKITDVTFNEPCFSVHDVFKNLAATADFELAQEIVKKAICAMPKSNKLAENFNITLQSLAEEAPKNATEARLCAQSMVLYAQGMLYLSRAENCDRIDHGEFYMKSAIKLLRLHNETIEALNKYRRGGEQRVIVQHVQVNDGGKAIVSNNLVAGGGGNGKIGEVIP